MPAYAQETTTYTYDTLGRLNGSSISGSVDNGVQVSTSFDAAGNRTNYSVNGSPTPTPPSFAISGPSPAVEGSTLIYTVTKTGANAAAVSINYATANGTATAGSDYAAASGTLTFAPTDTSKTISVTTIDDSVTESSETILVNLSGATGGATITTSQASGTITDNDAVPAVSFAISGPAAVVEGGTLVYTVTKTGSNASNVTVNYASASGTATSGSDFTAASGTLTFTPTDTSKTISVTTIDDSATESSETVLVDLSSPTGGATITTSQASGTITDNDGGTITLTNSFLGVLSAYTSVYGCSTHDYNTLDDSWTVRQCWLVSNNHSVYYESNQASNPQYTLAPGYSFVFGNKLAVQSAYYGTAP